MPGAVDVGVGGALITTSPCRMIRSAAAGPVISHCEVPRRHIAPSAPVPLPSCPPAPVMTSLSDLPAISLSLPGNAKLATRQGAVTQVVYVMSAQRFVRLVPLAISTALAVATSCTGAAWSSVRSPEDGIFHMSAPLLGHGV